ncbi:MAG: glycoside hydrolase family protein [Parcubacteria group bacterium]|jgi:lysozyme
MSIDPRKIAVIEGFEGRERKPYPDTHRPPKWSVGVGCNVEDDPPTLQELLAIMADGIPEAAIDLMRDNRIARAEKQLTWLFPSYPGWPPARQTALLSVIYTTGLKGLQGFHDMVDALKAGDWPRAAAELLDSRRSRETLKTSPRDEIEAQMILSGEWPS